jgi:hypothetical protein
LRFFPLAHPPSNKTKNNSPQSFAIVGASINPPRWLATPSDRHLSITAATSDFETLP